MISKKQKTDSIKKILKIYDKCENKKIENFKFNDILKFYEN